MRSSCFQACSARKLSLLILNTDQKSLSDRYCWSRDRGEGGEGGGGEESVRCPQRGCGGLPPALSGPLLSAVGRCLPTGAQTEGRSSADRGQSNTHHNQLPPSPSPDPVCVCVCVWVGGLLLVHYCSPPETSAPETASGDLWRECLREREEREGREGGRGEDSDQRPTRDRGRG